MNMEEKIAEIYLKSLDIGEIRFEPDGNITPDFSINNYLGVEARRLNQHFFKEERPVGLEQLEFPLWDMFIDVLRSFDKDFQGESYWISINFQRPLEISMKELKTQMKETLSFFLKTRPNLPCELQVNEQVNYYIFQSEPEENEVFREAGISDTDSGGFIISTYTENINHCIGEKSTKISNVFSRYKEWWLLLVNTMAWGMSEKERNEIKKHITQLGRFDKVLLIDREGNLLLAIESASLP